ncbi:MAG: hypothetical protein K2P84_14905 [Undibacterium sp.]|nr:hypothetical protein [Undibacterium sp.]
MKILHNHLGYASAGAKRALLRYSGDLADLADRRFSIYRNFVVLCLIDFEDHRRYPL